MKKAIFALISTSLIAFVFAGCISGLMPDTEGWESGPIVESAAERVVMIELFAATWCGWCGMVEPILEQLAEEYGTTQAILLEQHIWESDYYNEESENRFFWYPPEEEGVWGIPDVLFNGLNQRIGGAKYGTYENYKKAIEAERVKETEISRRCRGTPFSFGYF